MRNAFAQTLVDAVDRFRAFVCYGRHGNERHFNSLFCF